ncbi:hypothetical protein CCHR01_16172 [Colletotrichum chrysophilum]|uniref:Uncharacterized protein n=1 Tax=Colletotrichum chrysophilum TaxID=1836956 RepID=A0AAD9EDQ0_9PEZI|nr:hypothetical protein CCHR01_16172 [Colletotrichum chrysophilum]
MLQRGLGPRHGAIVRPPAQVPHQLGALRDARRAERVALGDEPAGRVDDVLAAVRDVPAADQLVRLAGLREAKRVEDDHLVGGEAVVQLDDLDVVLRDAGLGQGGLDGVLRHLEAHEVNGGAGEERGGVGGEALARDEDGLVLEVGALVKEGLGDEDGGGAAVGGRAALQLGEGRKDLGGLEDLLLGVDVLELGVGVAGGVLVVDAGDLGKVLGLGAVLLHVLAAGVAEHLGGAGGVCDAAGLGHHLDGGAGGVLAVVEEALQAAGHHLLEADDQHAVGGAGGDKGAGHGEAGAAGGAVVVDVVDGDGGHAELVEDALAAGAVAIAVAGDALVDVVVVDLGVEHGLDAGLEAQLRVVDLAAGLDELCHADAEDVARRLFALLSGSHVCGWCVDVLVLFVWCSIRVRLGV